MQNTKIIQGTFTSTGLPTTIAIPMGADWMEVIDFTQYGLAGSTPFPGLKYYWQRGMADGTGTIEYKNTQTVSVAQMTSGGFTLVDTTASPLGTPTNETANLAISAASPRVVTVTTGGSLYANMLPYNMVRFAVMTGSTPTLSAPLFAGQDFTFDTLAAASGSPTFNLTNTLTGSNTETRTALTAIVTPLKWNPYWYPSVRSIYYMVSSGVNTVIYPTVNSGYKTGMSVRIRVPSNTPTGTSWGMPQINNLVGNVIAVTTGVAGTADTVTVDINSSGFTVFNEPGTAGMPLETPGVQWATMEPIGNVSSQIIDTMGNPIPTNKFNQAEFNQGFTGMILGVGGTGAGLIAVAPTVVNISGPAGVSSDVMYWKAGGSFSNTVGLDSLPPYPPLGS